MLIRRAMMSLFPRHEVLTQEDQDDRTRYHIPMLDGGTIDSKCKTKWQEMRRQDIRRLKTLLCLLKTFKGENIGVNRAPYHQWGNCHIFQLGMYTPTLICNSYFEVNHSSSNKSELLVGTDHSIVPFFPKLFSVHLPGKHNKKSNTKAKHFSTTQR